ncbi:hypothetical protein PHMEG_00028307 [Phytophthora megakarya]|uniref:Uncharacterized protein n=1 Tax=Phytophthora megakarya TaxID=4795 RepID=A0A225V585_9STRA|nr:hypothetical protein PHMEG_00028307 [Phytophthora megakarya]
MNNLTEAAAVHQMLFTDLTVPASDDIVDASMVKVISELAVATNLPLPDFIRLVRGQTAAGPHPNKDLAFVSSTQ